MQIVVNISDELYQMCRNCVVDAHPLERAIANGVPLKQNQVTNNKKGYWVIDIDKHTSTCSICGYSINGSITNLPDNRCPRCCSKIKIRYPGTPEDIIQKLEDNETLNYTEICVIKKAFDYAARFEHTPEFNDYKKATIVNKW